MIKHWKTRWFLCFMFFTTLASAEERIAICYNYGCFSQAEAVYRDEQLRELSVLFSQVNNAAEERAVLADVVGRLFGWAGQQTPINADKGGNLADNAVDGKMDCIDHSLTTTRFLQMLEKRALLSFHRVSPRVLRRSFLIFEHYAAQIEEIAEGINDASDMAQQTPARYVVDAWFFDNGQPALVMPVEEWQAGGGPSVGQ